MPTIDITHPDFPALSMLNLILGGYFGSRLMTNIREEKGYTYGISSHIISMRNATYFTIITETGTEYTQLLIDEVLNEMNRLCQEIIPADELETARNYMQGQRARTLDSPFSISDYILSSIVAGNPIDYFNHENNAIRNMTAQELLRVANTHLHPDQLYIAIAGDKDKI
jgi:predicted Zn-dependent peptidase